MATKPSWARVEGPLAPYAQGFRSQLESQGYTLLTAAGHVRLMAHLSRWMAAEGLEVSAWTLQKIEEYFAVRRAVGYVNGRTVGALVLWWTSCTEAGCCRRVRLRHQTVQSKYCWHVSQGICVWSAVLLTAR